MLKTASKVVGISKRIFRYGLIEYLSCTFILKFIPTLIHPHFHSYWSGEFSPELPLFGSQRSLLPAVLAPGRNNNTFITLTVCLKQQGENSAAMPANPAFLLQRHHSRHLVAFVPPFYGLSASSRGPQLAQSRLSSFQPQQQQSALLPDTSTFSLFWTS